MMPVAKERQDWTTQAVGQQHTSPLRVDVLVAGGGIRFISLNEYEGEY